MPENQIYEELEQRVTETDIAKPFVKPLVINLYDLSITGGGRGETPVQTLKQGAKGQA